VAAQLATIPIFIEVRRRLGPSHRNESLQFAEKLIFGLFVSNNEFSRFGSSRGFPPVAEEGSVAELGIFQLTV
jgi:hypothetical protein